MATLRINNPVGHDIGVCYHLDCTGSQEAQQQTSYD